MTRGCSRRRFLGASAAALAALGAGRAARAAPPAPSPGRLKQSVCRWTLPGPLPEVCGHVKALGLQGIDLLYPDEWAVARDAGLVCSMGYASRREHFIEDGFAAVWATAMQSPIALRDSSGWPL